MCALANGRTSSLGQSRKWLARLLDLASKNRDLRRYQWDEVQDPGIDEGPRLHKVIRALRPVPVKLQNAPFEWTTFPPLGLKDSHDKNLPFVCRSCISYPKPKQ